jgi:hypothetical protein
MYDQRFFATRLGQSALLSIAAMITFVIFASAEHAPKPGEGMVVGAPLVQLA